LYNDNGRACEGSRNGPTEVKDGDAIAGVGDIVTAELLSEPKGEQDEDDGNRKYQSKMHFDIPENDVSK
jgi:hypothetical protein